MKKLEDKAQVIFYCQNTSVALYDILSIATEL